MATLPAQVYLIPYAIVNMWLVMITFLQHCHPSLPNYDDKEVRHTATQHMQLHSLRKLSPCPCEHISAALAAERCSRSARDNCCLVAAAGYPEALFIHASRVEEQ